MPKNNTGGAAWVANGLTWGLAGGIALGALVVAPAMAPIADNAFHNIDGPSETDGKGIGAESKPDDNPEADAANSLLAQVSTSLVEGVLEQRPVTIFRTPSADDEDVQAVGGLIEQAGGNIAGQITLTDKFLAQDGADELRSIVANTLPAGAQLSVENQAPGIHAGESLGAALMYDPASDSPLASVEDRSIVLQTLRDAGFIDYADGTVTPAQAIIVITGGDNSEERQATDTDDAFGATVLADLARGLDSRGEAVVVAGRSSSAAGEGTVAQVREDPEANAVISTVDSLDTEAGRLSAVLAVAEQIRGESGSYGSAANAQAPAPERPRD